MMTDDGNRIETNVEAGGLPDIVRLKAERKRYHG